MILLYYDIFSQVFLKFKGLKMNVKFDFFYSDPHFFHKNVIKYCDRPFENLNHMHETLIKNYNDTVGENEHCLWVGDCFFSKSVESVKNIMDRLNGFKSLVKGNHDWSDEKMLKMGFDIVCDGMSILIGGVRVQVKHFPFLKGDSSDLKYRHLRVPNDGQFLIHGHTHSKKMFEDRSIHVGVDASGFKPVSVKGIEDYISNVVVF